MSPDQIAAAQKELQTKSARINEIVANENATADQIREGETLHKDCLKLKSDLQAARENASTRDRLRLEAKGLTEWMNDGAGNPTAGSGPAARLIGTESAGHSTVERDREGGLQVLDEIGAGTFGQKTWELINSLEYKSSFRAYLRKGERARDQLKHKALNEATDDQGGVLAPAEMLDRIVSREPAPTSLRSLVMTANTGRDMLEAIRLQYSADDIYTTGIRVTATGEVISEEDEDDHNVDDSKMFGTVQIPVHTFMLSAALTNNMVEDSSFPIQAFLEKKFGETTDQLYERQILIGNGNGYPHGILFGALSGNAGNHPQYPEVILSGTAGGIDFDFINNLQMALPSQYENGNTRWVMNKKSTLSACYKLKDDQKRPLLSNGSGDYGMVGARGRVMLGDPIVTSDHMPGIGAAAFPIIYGDLQGFYLAQRLGFSIQVLNQTRAKRNQVELVGRVRFGGKVVEPWRLKIGKSNNA